MDVIKGKWAAVSAPTRAAPPSFSRSVGDLDLICPIFVAAVQFYVDKIVSDGKIDGMKALLLDEETVRA